MKLPFTRSSLISRQPSCDQSRPFFYEYHAWSRKQPIFLRVNQAVSLGPGNIGRASKMKDDFHISRRRSSIVHGDIDAIAFSIFLFQGDEGITRRAGG